MIKNSIIVILIALILYMGHTLIRVENEREALIVGMCRNKLDPALPPDSGCLSTVETRTHWLWHLYYPLTGS